MSKWARRVDGNHAQVVKAFRDLGCSVADTSRLPNFVDLVVSAGGDNWLIEVKTSKGKLSQSQIEFREAWLGHYAVVRDIDEVAETVNQMRGHRDRRKTDDNAGG